MNQNSSNNTMKVIGLLLFWPVALVCVFLSAVFGLVKRY